MPLAQSFGVTLDEPSSSPALGVQPTPARPTIPDYELLKFVDRGSYGDVWLARSVTGLYRAVKIVWRARFPDPQPYEREFKGLKEFAAISLYEARQLALLHVGRTEEFFYYVMELADDAETGRDINPETYRPNTLKEVRERRGRLPAAEAVTLGVELARGLGALHAHGLVHRDIKPSNVILVGGSPKLADIGLVATASAALTFVGTEGYVPPEGPGAPAADVFSLGKVLYELATGLDRRDYPSLPGNLGDFADRKELLELNAVIVRACEPDARNRFSDAAALRDELLLLQAGKSVRRLRAMEQHLSRALRAAAILAVATAVAGTGAWIAQRRADREMALRAQAEAERDLLARKSVYSATLTRAQRALEMNEHGLARRHLRSLVPAAGDPDLRGFEWHALWQDALGDPALLVETGGELVKQLGLSPDGTVVAAQIGDRQMLLLDAVTLRQLRTIPGTRTLGGFSPDGGWLVGTESSGGLQRWRFSTGEPGGRASPDLNYVGTALDADRVIGALRDNREFAVALRRWNFAQQRDEIRIPPRVKDREKALFTTYPAVDRHGQRCAMVLLDQSEDTAAWRLQVFNFATGQVEREYASPLRTTAVALSPDGALVAAAYPELGAIVMRALADDRVLWQQPARMSVVQTLAFSPSGERLAAGGHSSAVHVFGARDGAVLRSFTGHERDAVALQWIGETKLVSGGTGGDVRRWELDGPPRTLTRTGPATSGFLTQPICVSDGGKLFATTDAGKIRVATVRPDPASDQVIDARFPLAFASDGRVLLALTPSGVLREVELGAQPVTHAEHALLPAGRTLNCAGLSANGEVGAAATLAGEIWFWHMGRRALLGARQIGQPFMWVALSPTGERAVTNGRENVIRLWSTAEAQPLLEIPNPLRRAFHGLFSPDGRTFALCMDRGEVEIRATSTGEVLQRITTDSENVYSAAFSADSRRLYCGGSRGAVHIYSTDDWRLIVTFSVSSGDDRDAQILGLAATTGHEALIAYRADGLIRVWNAVAPILPQSPSRP